MRFSVTILGTGSARPTTFRHHSAHALNVHEQFYLVDCGEGTQVRLLECGINPLKLSAAFISHLHGDHVYGLFPLISSMGIMGRKTPFTVYAPRPFGEIMESHFRHFDLQLPFEVVWCEVDTRVHGLIFENRVMEVWSIPLRHRVPTSGYLFREKAPALNIRPEAIERYSLSIAQITAVKRGEDIFTGGDLVRGADITYVPYSPRSYAYCSDTLPSPKAAALVAGTDLLYHEATFADGEKTLARETGHSTASQAATIALKASAGRLLIGHFSSRYKDATPLLDQARTIFPATDIALEGHTYDIPIRRAPEVDLEVEFKTTS